MAKPSFNVLFLEFVKALFESNKDKKGKHTFSALIYSIFLSRDFCNAIRPYERSIGVKMKVTTLRHQGYMILKWPCQITNFGKTEDQDSSNPTLEIPESIAQMFPPWTSPSLPLWIYCHWLTNWSFCSAMDDKGYVFHIHSERDSSSAVCNSSIAIVLYCTVLQYPLHHIR